MSLKAGALCLVFGVPWLQLMIMVLVRQRRRTAPQRRHRKVRAQSAKHLEKLEVELRIKYMLKLAEAAQEAGITDLGTLGLSDDDLAFVSKILNPRQRSFTPSPAQSLTSFAALIAGRRRRPDLRDEWRSHLGGESGSGLSPRRRALAALGFIVAAFRYRLRDVADIAWVPADRVLGSRTLSNLFVLVPTVAVGVINFFHAGAIGITESMENIAATVALFYGLIRCGRWWRGVKLPDPKPRTKD